MNATLLPSPRDPVAYPLDAPLSLGVALLLAFGCVMVYSASTETALLNYNQSQALLWRHLAYLVAALFAGLVMLSIPIAWLRQTSFLALCLTVLLLVLVLLPGVGVKVNGARRWIRLVPFGSVQSSELAKLGSLVFFAGYFERHKAGLSAGWQGFILPMLVLMLLCLLLLLEPDFGAAVVLTCSVLGVMFLAGSPPGRFLVLLFGSLAAGLLLAVLEPYRLQRLSNFVDPWKHAFGDGYQLTQALIAFGRGEWWGLGLGNSIQKLSFLPEAHTDFVYSVVAEELGAAGSLAVIGLCVLIIWRALVIGYRAEVHKQLFAAYLAYGIGLLLAAQMFINLGVNLGSLPTKGLTLPFVSYGGNSLIVCVVAVALVLRIDYENRTLRRRA